jgi:hypothetical protein
MDKDLEFNFNMLSRRQLQKLCNYYSLKISGSLPNKYTTDDELLHLVEENLQVLDDGTIARKEDKEDIVEVKLLGGSRIRMIII